MDKSLWGSADIRKHSRRVCKGCQEIDVIVDIVYSKEAINWLMARAQW
ncbi:hypothetical protein LINPERPRIM_LOCUS23700 [Linum perenne]